MSRVCLKSHQAIDAKNKSHQIKVIFQHQKSEKQEPSAYNIQ
jgi:hypothetical protein